MAKYRGNSDEWLDSNLKSGRVQNRKIKKDRSAETIPWEETNATVVEVFPNQCRVRPDHESAGDLLCPYRRAQMWRNTKERSPVSVGDRVKFERIGGIQSRDGVVVALGERKNRLARPAPGREIGAGSSDPKELGLVHVVVANLDLLVIVTSTSNPEFSPGIVDRFLIAVQKEGIRPLIVVNKMDLLNSALPTPWKIYLDYGIEVQEVCAKSGIGIEALQSRLAEFKTVAFCGHSGVGKTSLLRRLTGDLSLGKTSEVNDLTGKGKHTTTSARVVTSGSQFFWIDTPGVKEFGLLDFSTDELSRYFPEMQRLSCASEGCTHVGEGQRSSCEAIELPRYQSFVRIYQSLLTE